MEASSEATCNKKCRIRENSKFNDTDKEKQSASISAKNSTSHVPSKVKPTKKKIFAQKILNSPSSTFYRSRQLEAFEEEEDEENVPSKDTHSFSNDGRHVSGAQIADFDEISTGLPSDLPSDLFDVEGNLLYGNIQHLRFGLDEDDFSSVDDVDDNVSRGGRSDNAYKFKNDEKLSPTQAQSKKSPLLEEKSTQKPYLTSITSPSTSSTDKFAPILPTCDTPAKVEGSRFPKAKNDKTILRAGHLVCDNVGVQGKGKKKKIVNQNAMRKLHSGEEMYHPLITSGNKSKTAISAATPNYPGMMTAKRQLSSSSGTSGSTAANNTTATNTSSSSGNFSPPSDQFRHALAPFDRHHSSGGASSNSNSTITQHYYPESGFGYVVLMTCTICHVLTSFQLSFGILYNPILDKFGSELHLISCWLGAVSLGISLLFSPVWVSICKKKSTRLSAVFGGLMASLGCLFTSFASQFHQTFISYGAFLGIGVGLSRDAASLMVGQYFKRKREVIEIIVVSGSGLGIILMSISIHTAIGSLGWRLGLQAVCTLLVLTFFLGTCYRSASLYHPQRRAILHLKNQKRKVKEKGKREDKPPFIDCSCLRSKTLRIILMSSSCTAFGIFTPLLSLAVQCSKKGFEDCSVLLLHIYVGTSWIIGCCTLGLVVIQKSQDCRVSKQYLCQVASVICGISILALTAVKGNNGMVVFSWVYGASLGAYCYCLKVYTYERARARHFPRAWSFVQSSQAIPLFFGVPLTNYANEMVGWKSGYYMSALAVFVGTACLFLTDVRRRKLSRRKSQNSSVKTCETTDGGGSESITKRLSFAFPVDFSRAAQQQQQGIQQDSDDEIEVPAGQSNALKDLTIISEEGLLDMDFQDICYFDDEWAEYIGECITSCGKVENCLVSEFDPEMAILVERRARRENHQQIQGSIGGSKVPVALPGLGMLEVPLLVKRLHPVLGVRSHYKSQATSNNDHCRGNCGSRILNRSVGEPNLFRGDDANDSVGSAGAIGQTRVYHHQGNARANLADSHFPAIDEDSV